MRTFDVAVIGGGISGLVAAGDLARAGRAVVVLEKAAAPGGRAATVRKDGACFNLGAHALYLGGEMEKALAENGVPMAGAKPSVSGGAVLWGGKAIGLTKLLAGMLSWPAKAEFALLAMKLSKLEPASLAGISLREWAEKEIRDPMVRHIVYAICRTSTFTPDPDYQFAESVLPQVAKGLKGGVRYVDRGWQPIVDGLRDAAVRAGAAVLTGQNVREIGHEKGRIRRVVLSDGASFDVAQAVSTLPPRDLCKLVPGADVPSLLRWRDQARPAMVASLDLCLRKLPVRGRNFVLGIDQPVFFTNQSAAASLSDNGGLVMHVTKYNGPEGGDPEADRRLLEHAMDLAHPGWREEVITSRFLPNLAASIDYSHRGRADAKPGPRVPELHGLYVAGEWASHGEFLADAAAASARRASAAALQDCSAGRAAGEPAAAAVV